MSFRSQVLGCGGYLPERIVTNAELAARLDTSDEWIVQRTGIRQRHIAAPGEFTSDLAIKAAERALAAAGRKAGDIDLDRAGDRDARQHLSRHRGQGAGAPRRHASGAAFDVQAVCTGFIYALPWPTTSLRCGQAKRALVIGAETFSRILDWKDRGTCVLFGDGAGALVLEAKPANGSAIEGRGSNRRNAAFSRPICTPTAAATICFMSMAARPPPGLPVILRMEGKEDLPPCGRSAWPRWCDEALDANGLEAKRNRLAGAAPGQPPDHRRHAARSWALRATRW